MNLKDFIKVTHEEVDEFHNWYLRQREEAKPEHQWPLEMNEGDWYEQFMMWETSRASWSD